MAMAHVCLGCGLDLARQRAVVEPHYRLPLITCPRCRRATVRSRHPLIRQWRAVVRTQSAISVLVLQALIVVGLTAATLFSSFAMVLVFWQAMGGEVSADAGWFVLWPLALVGPLTGVWLTAGLAHLPRRRAWLGWFIWIALGITVVSMAVGLQHGAPPGATFSHRMDAPLAQQLPGIAAVITLPALAGFAAMIASAAIFGIPLGLGVKAGLQLMQRHLWRLALRRSRRARAS